MDLVEYACTKCKRSARAPRARAQQVLESGRGCQFCGGALAFPRELGPGARAKASGAAHVHSDGCGCEHVSLACGCENARSKPLVEVLLLIAQSKTKCPVCREEYEIPP